MPSDSAKRILIVEDERIIALDLRSVLEEFGYQVVGMAANGDEAIQKALETQPDLVLMDIRIQGASDGIETAARLKQRLVVPVVYLSANVDQNTLRRALETEPAGYLAKPYNARTLHTTIQVALRRHAAEQRQKAAHTQERRRFERQSDQLVALTEVLRVEAETDSLTQLHNRRYLDHLLGAQLALCERDGEALGFIMLDLDEFKQLNDAHGHLAGDCVLRAVGAYLLKHLRGRDVACRYGGEEIVIVAPGVSLSDAIGLADRLRQGIKALSVDASGGALKITASFGVAAFPDHAMKPELLIQAADAALYRAKLAGRNRVVAASL